MTKTVIALYDRFDTAQRVVENLTEAGFDRQDISLLANDAAGEYAQHISGESDVVLDEDVSAGEGAGFGAIIGTLIGLGAALIPGIGPVIGAGPLAVALTAGIGAAAGAITGGITAGLIDLGIDEEDAGVYAEGVRRGGTLLTVSMNDEWTERAEQIMNHYNPVNVDTRSSLWRDQGWSGFDEKAQPYDRDQIEQERQMFGSPTLNGQERHHETSNRVEDAVNRDNDGGSAFDDQEVETRQVATTFGAGSIDTERNVRSYPRTGGVQDTNPLDTNNLNR